MADIFVSKYDDKDVVSAYINNKLEYMSVVYPSPVGNIYLCRVDNIVKNLSSAFVRFDNDKIGYVSFKSIICDNVINRTIEKPGDIRQGDSIILQVDTDEMKLKKPKLSSMLSISEDTCVVTLGKKGVGVSRKLPEDLRNRLLETVRAEYEALLPEYTDRLPKTDFGVIIRTDAASLSEDEIKTVILADIRKCLERIIEIYNIARTRTVFSCLYKNNSDDPKEHIGKAAHFLSSRGYTGSHVHVLYDSVIYNTKLEIEKLGHNKVWLKSGAFLIIEQLESFNAIDVNTGKAVADKKDVIKNVNFEAAKEIFRQIRLRNLSGMILIDFINMKSREDIAQLCDLVKELSRKEPVHTEFVDITGLGIIELTRSKNEKSLKEILDNTIKSVDSIDNEC